MRVTTALCVILAIGIVAEIPQGVSAGHDGKEKPEFFKKCKEETGFEHKHGEHDKNEPVSEKEACFSECLMKNTPEDWKLEALEKKCKESGDSEDSKVCKFYELAKKMEECVKNAKPSTQECPEGSKMAECHRKLHKEHHKKD